MAAESLPFSFGTLSSWELEAWYEDLQEVLSSDENGSTYVSPPGNEVRSRGMRPELGGDVAVSSQLIVPLPSRLPPREKQKLSPLLTLPLWRG